jgi:DNA helicase-2/ATP-dependent DNA helicase PcrA
MKTVSFDLSDDQKQIIDAEGHLLVVGGPGSGKTTVSILKAEKIATQLKPGQKILFLSFARATVSRVIEAIEQHSGMTKQIKEKIEVDTYHSFFWKIVKTHGYLIGLPRRVSILTPPAEAVALSAIRHEYKAESKLTAVQKEEKHRRSHEERIRLANTEGKLCFDLFANYVVEILSGGNKIRQLICTAYPYIVLDEFQDTSAEQWNVVKSLGKHSTLISLADPEQRIFDFIGADPERLDHFRAEFSPEEFDLRDANHRSQGTDIAIFGNDILKGQYRDSYNGVEFNTFNSNQNQAFATLKGHTLQARKRLIDAGKPDWSLAILVPTKRMMRQVSDSFRIKQTSLPAIRHVASIDMHGAILAAEILGFFLQPKKTFNDEQYFIELICSFFQGKGGEAPSKKDITEASSIRKAYTKALQCRASGKPFPKKSIIIAILDVYNTARQIILSGDPDADWIAARSTLEECSCPRLKQVAEEARNLRLLNRGTQLRESLSQCWRDYGAYANALDIVRNSFIQEHFATANKPETGVVIMNMHKAKGKQFDEVIIFEGWPQVVRGKIVSNSDRIVRGNSKEQDLTHYRQNFRVSVTRAKSKTTILTPANDPCVLLIANDMDV